MKHTLEELFDKWLENKDTTENVINHLKGQKFFHLDFLKFVIKQCNASISMDLKRPNKKDYDFLDLFESNRYAINITKYVNKLEEQLRIGNVSILLLKKYMQHVENCEGNNFVSDIGMSWSGIEFSKEEKALLEKLNKDTLCDDPLQDYLNDVVYCENCGNDVEK